MTMIATLTHRTRGISKGAGIVSRASFLLAAVCAVFLWDGRSGITQVRAAADLVQITVALSDDTIVAGQPVTATVTIKNTSKVGMKGPEFASGQSEQWLRFSLQSKAGKEIRPDPRPRNRFGFDSSSRWMNSLAPSLVRYSCSLSSP